MGVRLIFLGKLADIAGAGAWDWAADAPMGWDDILARMEPALRSEIDCGKVRVAINGAVLADKRAIVAAKGDEIAFLPPVSGG